jgi:hypothetical protein
MWSFLSRGRREVTQEGKHNVEFPLVWKARQEGKHNGQFPLSWKARGDTRGEAHKGKPSCRWTRPPSGSPSARGPPSSKWSLPTGVQPGIHLLKGFRTEAAPQSTLRPERPPSEAARPGVGSGVGSVGSGAAVYSVRGRLGRHRPVQMLHTSPVHSPTNRSIQSSCSLRATHSPAYT